MTPYRHICALLLAASLLATVVGCAVPHATENLYLPGQMTFNEARKALAESIHHTSSKFLSTKEIRISHKQLAYLSGKGDPRQKKVRLRFAAMDNLSIRNSWDSTVNVSVNGKETDFYWERADRPFAQLFIDAVLALKQAALAPDTEEETNFTAFTARAKTWLATTPRTAMPDEARAYKGLAEDAFKRKDFTAALDAYRQALDSYPTWPEGQYNAALLAAEAEEYDWAAQHMRRYLVLAANAKDATSAKDKLLLWQLKARE